MLKSGWQNASQNHMTCIAGTVIPDDIAELHIVADLNFIRAKHFERELGSRDDGRRFNLSLESNRGNSIKCAFACWRNSNQNFLFGMRS